MDSHRHPSPASPARDLAAKVVAWHNRNPFTRRIGTSQVTGIGVVALPFSSAAAASPGEPVPGGQLTLPAAEAAALSAASLPTADAEPPASGRPSPTLQRLLGRCSAAWQPLAAAIRALRDRTGGAGRARPPRLRSAFIEDFIAPLKPGQVARFALRHGNSRRPGPADWPQRDVAMAAGAARSGAVTRFVQTAAIEVDGTRRRVLIGAGPRPSVIGPRAWSRRRLLAGGSGLAAALLAAVLLLSGEGLAQAPAEPDTALLAAASPSPPPGVAVAAPVGPPPSAAGAGTKAAGGVVAPADSPSATGAQTNAQGAAVAGASTPADSPVADAAGSAGGHGTALTAAQPGSAASASKPPSAAADVPAAPADAVDPEPPVVPASQTGAAASRQAAPDSRPPSSPERHKLARQHGAEARPANAVQAGSPAATLPQAAVFAVITPPTRSRTGAQLRIALMEVPTSAEPGEPRAEAMQVGQGWRAVLWPFSSRQAAEQTRDRLAARGIPAKVIEF